MARNAEQFLLPERLDLAAVSEALRPALSLEAHAASDGERAFYDTFDGRLHRAGVTLVHDGDRLAMFDSQQRERATVPCRKLGARLIARELQPGRLRDLLVPLVDMRALTRIARVRGPRQLVRVLDSEGKTVVRLVLEQPRLVGGRDRELRPRLHAIGVLGYDKTLARVCRVLEKQLGLVAADVPLHDEAVGRAGGTPGGISSKVDVGLSPGDRADTAAAHIFRRLLEVVEGNLPGTLADIDSEFLHDLRVAVRRTRALQRELRKAFPPESLEHFRAEFRWLQAVTGPTRDLDVYLLEFDDFVAAVPAHRRADLEPVRGLLARRRARERRAMVQALRSPRTSKLIAEWSEFLGRLEAGDAGGPDADRPVVELASARIGKVYRRMVKAGSAIDDSSAPEALHDLRKAGKELRYLLEFFASLYPARVIKPMVRTLKSLQDTLGRFQDREVQAELIHSLGDDITTVDGGAAALMAMGQLIERLEEQQADARTEFAERFAAFASPKQRALVRETFA